MGAPRKAVVVAHPDDEALWLSSAIASADRVVLSFGAVFENPRMSAARRQAVAALPLTGIVDLAIPESGVHHSIEGMDPQPTPSGLRIADAAKRARYEANFPRLLESLRAALDGFADVYTHNPWGEYGHPEHVQVHRAVTTLQRELGFTVWFSNYVSAASWPLARRLGDEVRWAERRIVRPDVTLAHRLMSVYRAHGAWTWKPAHRWPAREAVYALPPAGSPVPQRPITGEWLLDVARLRWWSPPWRFARRRLTPLPQGPRVDRDVHAPPRAR